MAYSGKFGLLVESNKYFNVHGFRVIYDVNSLAPTYQVLLSYNDFVNNLITLKQRCAILIHEEAIEDADFTSYDKTIESYKKNNIVIEDLLVNNVATIKIAPTYTDSFGNLGDTNGGKVVSVNLLPKYLYERCENYYFKYGVESSKVINTICQKSPFFSKKIEDKKITVKNSDKFDFLDFELNEGSTIGNIKKITNRILLKNSPAYFFENANSEFKFTSYNQELSDKSRVYAITSPILDQIGLSKRWDFDFKIGKFDESISRAFNEKNRFITTKNSKLKVLEEDRKSTYGLLEGDEYKDFYQLQLRGINNSEILAPYANIIKEPTNSELRSYEMEVQKKRELEGLYQITAKADKLDIISLSGFINPDRTKRIFELGALHKLVLFPEGFVLNNTIMMLKRIYLDYNIYREPEDEHDSSNMSLELTFEAPTLMYYTEDDLKEVRNYETLAKKF